MSQPTPTVRDLVDRLAAGQLTPDDMAALSQIVCGDPRAADEYVRRVQVIAGLESGHASVSVPVRSPLGRWVKRALGVTVLAAGLLLGVVGLPTGPVEVPVPSVPSGPPVPVARIARVADCRPADPRGQYEVGDELGPGANINLTAGVVDVACSSDVRLTIVGPAVVDLTTAESATVRTGRVGAVLPADGGRYELRAGSVMVRGTGCEFGVAVDPRGSTDVFVFEGEADIAVPGQPDSRVGQGGAVRADPAARAVVPISFRPSGFGRALDHDPKQPVRRFRDDLTGRGLAADWRLALPGRRATGTPTDTGFELAGGAILSTAAEYDPVSAGFVRVTGVWQPTRFRNDGEGEFDLLDVYTRCDPTPDPRSPAWAIASGIRFRVNTSRPVPGIAGRPPLLKVAQHATSGSLRVVEGGKYRFAVSDDGRGLSITVTDLADPANTATATAVLATDTSDRNAIAFGHRTGLHTARLSGVEITTGPVVEAWP